MTLTVCDKCEGDGYYPIPIKGDSLRIIYLGDIHINKATIHTVYAGSAFDRPLLGYHDVDQFYKPEFIQSKPDREKLTREMVRGRGCPNRYRGLNCPDNITESNSACLSATNSTLPMRK